MKYVSDERLKEIFKSYAHAPGDYIDAKRFLLDYLIKHECKELSPWLPLEEFLKSDHEGYCLVCYKGSAEMTIYRHGVFHVVQLDDIVCLSTDYITHVMPIQTPADQKE